MTLWTWAVKLLKCLIFIGEDGGVYFYQCHYEDNCRCVTPSHPVSQDNKGKSWLALLISINKKHFKPQSPQAGLGLERLYTDRGNINSQ